MTNTAIRWPDRYAPGRAPIHVVNDLAMATPPEAVWKVVIRAADWPGFYANASKVVVEGGGPDFSAGARFAWKPSASI